MITNKPCPCQTCILYCKCASTLQTNASTLYTVIIPFCSTIRKYLWVTQHSSFGFHYGGNRKDEKVKHEYRERYFRFLNMLQKPINLQVKNENTM